MADPIELENINDSGKHKATANKQKTFQDNLATRDGDNVSLVWNHLTCTVQVVPPEEKKKPFFKKKNKVKKVILNDITASAGPGQFLAVMGPSGAGKTSLLNLISGREIDANSTLEGDLLINGKPLDRRSLKGISGYVLQDDSLLPHLTVREAITFSAKLRLPATMSMEEKLQRVDAVITELNLSACADTKIGNAMVKGVSGGERKRCAIGVELITDPSILFLDEPTTGLDSFTSMGLIETLKGLSRNNRTVICTIHQPQSSIYELFDKLLLLARGQIVYFGPADEAVDYFASQDLHCPLDSNPADYFLDITADDTRSPEAAAASDERITSLIAAYKESKYAHTEPPPHSGTINNQGRTANLATQFRVLYQRSMRNASRDVLTYGVRVVQNVVLGVLVGLIYLNIDNDQTSIQDRLGLLFFVMINQGFSAMFTALNIYPAERRVVQRERKGGFYQVLPYFLAKTISELPLQFIYPIILGVIVYWMGGLQSSAGKFFLFLVLIELSSYCADSLGLLLSIVMPNQGVALAVGPLLMVVFLLFGGFYINIGSVPPYFIWISYISFIRWGFEGLAVNEFTGLTLRCKSDQLTPSGDCPFERGSQVLRQYEFHEGSVWRSALILIGLYIVLRVLCYVGLRLKKKLV